MSRARQVARLFFLTAIVGLSAAILFGFVVVIALYVSYRPEYGTDSVDYDQYSAAFSGIEKIAAGSRQPLVVDFADLKGGRWRSVCLIGGYEDPIRVMRQQGASISPEDERRMAETARAGFRLGAVEEFEVMIAYTDDQNLAHFIHFERGFGPEGQHFQKCVSKPETVIQVYP